MGFNWKKALLGVAGNAAEAYTGIPVGRIINQRVKRQVNRDDPEKRPEFLAAAMREAAKASLPDASVEQIDRIFLAWSILAAQERADQEEYEEEEPAATPPPRRKRRKTTRKRKVKG